jgi:hypothetical protein
MHITIVAVVFGRILVRFSARIPVSFLLFSSLLPPRRWGDILEWEAVTSLNILSVSNSRSPSNLI